jgi:hypothetical protein
VIRWNKLPSTLMVATVLVLTAGCSPQAPELSVDAARELQSRLPEVRQAAAGNDYARALTLLEQFKKDLDEAAGEGKMTFARYQGISSAWERVRAELQVLAAAAVQEADARDVASPAPGPAATANPDAGTALLPPESAPVPENAEEPNSAPKVKAGKASSGKSDPGGNNKDP